MNDMYFFVYPHYIIDQRMKTELASALMFTKVIN